MKLLQNRKITAGQGELRHNEPQDTNGSPRSCNKHAQATIEELGEQLGETSLP